jgi:hypothetical protein
MHPIPSCVQPHLGNRRRVADGRSAARLLARCAVLAGTLKGLQILAYWSRRGLALAPNASTPAEGYGVDDAAEDDGDASSCAGLE